MEDGLVIFFTVAIVSADERVAGNLFHEDLRTGNVALAVFSTVKLATAAAADANRRRIARRTGWQPRMWTALELSQHLEAIRLNEITLDHVPGKRRPTVHNAEWLEARIFAVPDHRRDKLQRKAGIRPAGDPRALD
jgi:hypothetical protein